MYHSFWKDVQFVLAIIVGVPRGTGLSVLSALHAPYLRQVPQALPRVEHGSDGYGNSHQGPNNDARDAPPFPPRAHRDPARVVPYASSCMYPSLWWDWGGLRVIALCRTVAADMAVVAVVSRLLGAFPRMENGKIGRWNDRKNRWISG